MAARAGRDVTLGCATGAGLSPERTKADVTLSCSFQPMRRLTLGAGVAVYPIPGQQVLSDSDFNLQASYALSRRFRLEYSSYSGNRWKTLDLRELAGGSAFLTYALPAPWATKHASAMVRSLACNAAVGRPLLRIGDADATRAAVSCGINPTPRLSIRLTESIYPAGQQKPWDPDFSYSINYQILPKVAIGYANYSGNRWLGRAGGAGNFARGAFYVSYSLPVKTLWHER
jgi:hypothetical protein